MLKLPHKTPVSFLHDTLMTWKLGESVPRHTETLLVCSFISHQSVWNKSLQHLKETKKTKKHTTTINCLNIFWHQIFKPPSITMRRRTEEWGSIHDTWIINHFSSTAYGNSNTSQRGEKRIGWMGGGGYLRRISETGKVTKSSSE